MLHYFIVCFKTVGILPFLEWHCWYQICVSVVCNHEILVSTAVMDREAICVVSIKSTDGRDLEKDIVGSDLGHRLLR